MISIETKMLKLARSINIKRTRKWYRNYYSTVTGGLGILSIRDTWTGFMTTL